MKKSHSPKTPRGEESRKKIIEETRLLLANSDIHSVSLDQISERVGLAKTSILWHFGSKEGLLLEVLDTIFRDLTAALETTYPADTPPSEGIVYFLHDYGRLMKTYPEIMRVWFSVIFSEKTSDTIRQRVREIYSWTRDVFIRNFSVSENSAAAIVGMLDGIALQSFVDPKSIDMDQVFDSLVPELEALINARRSQGEVPA